MLDNADDIKCFIDTSILHICNTKLPDVGQIFTSQASIYQLVKQLLGSETKGFNNKLLSEEKDVIFEWEAEKRDKYNTLFTHFYTDDKSVQNAHLKERKGLIWVQAPKWMKIGGHRLECDGCFH